MLLLTKTPEQIFLWGLNLKDFVLVAGTIVTFLAVIANLVVAFQNSRDIRRNLVTTKYIDTITSERIKWMEKLRSDISKFAGLTHFWVFSIDDKQSKEAMAVMNEIDNLRYLIQLRLNPAGEYDKQIIKLIKDIPDLASTKGDVSLLHKAIEELINTSQKMLKAEWTRVKAESIAGFEVKQINQKKEN